jgi:hypothetical protein
MNVPSIMAHPPRVQRGDREVTVTDLEAVFLAKEGKVAAQFQDEVFEIEDKGSLEIVMGDGDRSGRF